MVDFPLCLQNRVCAKNHVCAKNRSPADRPSPADGPLLRECNPQPASAADAASAEATAVFQDAGRPQLNDFPALASLNISLEQLSALARQGFVARDGRGSHRYKLRFRINRRQMVRYIGGGNQAQEVKQELAALQAPTRLDRKLQRLRKIAAQQLRQGKQRLQPLLAKHGYHFHGLAIRQTRSRIV